jgi:transposase
MKMRVDYIKRPYKDKTYVYPFLVSSYRDENGVSRNKVIQNLSHLPEYVVEAIRIALRSEGEVKSVPVDTIKYLDSLPFGDTWAVWTIMKQIGIVDALEKLPDNHSIPIIASIVDRVINPKPYSKRALWDAFESSALKKILQVIDQSPLHHWYNALDSLYDCQMDIQKQLYQGHTNRVYLYDITSSYFEGTCCPLSDWGYNRDGKKGKMIIVIGLLTTEEGRPIAVRVFPGNTNDQTTVIRQLKELKTEFGVQEIIFVGDRGMITSKRITEIESDDLNWVKYITALKRQDMMRMVEDIHHPIQLGLFDHQHLVELDHEGKRYILCHNPLRKDEDSATRLRLLEKTEEKLQSIANNVKNGRLKDKDRIARRLYRWINKWNMERFFNVEYRDCYFSFGRNQEEIERYAILDGCYVIISNVKAEELNTSSVHSKYKDLKYVENAFRSMKVSDLFLRPIRHWTETRVQGHVFMCMLAYLVVWEAKKRLRPLLDRDQHSRECEGNSLREIWDALKKLSIGHLSIAGIESEQLGEITKDQKNILKTLRTPITKKDKEKMSLLI